MANREKYTRASVGHMCKHYGRLKDEKGNYYKFGNQDIDYERTHLNYNLAANDQPKDQQQFIKERMEELKCLNRKDVNVMMSWLVTLPKEMNEKPMSEQRKFFEKSYEFLKERYGADNVVSAYVHMDESQPHMHFAYTPVCWDGKAERYRFNAKKVGSRKDLQTFHKDFDEEMTKQMGYITGVRNGATEINQSIHELKAMQKKMVEIDNELDKIRSEMPQKGVLGYNKKQVDSLVRENELLRKQRLLSSESQKALETANHGLQNQIKNLKSSSSVKKRKELVVQVKDLQVQVIELRKQNEKLENKNTKLENKAQEIWDSANYSLKSYTDEIDNLKSELEEYKNFYDRVIDFIRNMIHQGLDQIVDLFKSFLEPHQVDFVEQTIDEIEEELEEEYELEW
ncbi:MAG: plasmid recombination protein [Lactobacillus sp.]|nr:plasmid recombination protein [Lactobacillus sp.]